MFIRTPYDTKILKFYNSREVKNNVNRYLVNYRDIEESSNLKLKPFVAESYSLKPVMLYGLTDIEKDIPIVTEPLIDDNKWMLLDLRQVVKPIDERRYEIRNEAEYDLLVQRFIIAGLFYTGSSTTLNKLKLPHMAYADWLSMNLTKRFGLDLGTSYLLKVLGLIYYESLFYNDEKPSAEVIDKLIIKFKSSSLETSIRNVYEKIEKLNSIDDFCENCYIVTNNIRLKNLDYNVLINVFSNNWLGLNSKELVITSLEYPPNWIAIVYSSLVYRGFNKSYISGIVDRVNKKGEGDLFVKELIRLTKSQKQE